MKIQCMCSRKPESECGVIKQLNRDGLSYRDIGVKSKWKSRCVRLLDIDIEHATDKNIEKLKEAYANACDSCVQNIEKYKTR